MDEAHEQTEKMLETVEKRIHAAYAKAYSDMKTKLKEAGAEYESALIDAKKSLSAEDFKKWNKEQLAKQKWISDMADSLGADLEACEEIAAKIVSRSNEDVYALNANAALYEVESGTGLGTSFQLVDHSTVERLMRDNPQLYPTPKIKKGKSSAWNSRHVRSAITQGILQGESIDRIASRISGPTGMSMGSAIRVARTATTGAENGGRVDYYRMCAQELGITILKKWMSTEDARTRPEHAARNGVSIPIDDEFAPGLSFPGDPHGQGLEVYNCRCTLVADMPEAKAFIDAADKSLKGKSFEEWKGRKERQATISSYNQKAAELDALRSKAMDFKAAHENDFWPFVWSFDSFEHDKELAEKANGKKAKLFLKYGKRYQEMLSEVDRLQAELDELGKSLDIARAEPSDAFSKARKDAAWWFKDKKKADAELRPKAGEVWRTLTTNQKRSLYGYTSDSNEWNQPTNGFKNGRWGRENYVGPGNVNIDSRHYGMKIRQMTEAISKSSYDHDMWLNRGSGTDAMDTFFGLEDGGFANLSDDELQKLVGKSGRVGGFWSTSASKGNGFSRKPVIINVYAPAGSNMIYAEPFSAFGCGNGLEWDGKSGQEWFGREFEVILQRGGSYKVTKIEHQGGKYYIDMELHPEDGYDLFQQEVKK